VRANIQKTFGFEIAVPTFFRAFYWETGTAFWKPNCDSRTLAKQMIRPIACMPLWVCGENFSESQGWMEGALETSWEVLHELKV
jgi:monoamine oxidase